MKIDVWGAAPSSSFYEQRLMSLSRVESARLLEVAAVGSTHLVVAHEFATDIF
jgi:hypothetical protein